jgi:beta-N-acetylhexosaminidase
VARATTGGVGPDDILEHLMLAFEGRRVPRWAARRLATAPASGITLFRHHNVGSPDEVRELTDAVQAAARRRDPAAPQLLIAADQEGGQFLAMGEGATPFAGNMALGAAGDEGLAERVGRAIGTELRAMGVNVDYAPIVDVATNPANPALGIRSFGDDPAAVGRLAAAMVRGLRGAGIAATAKHFPGKGDVSVDTHHGLATIAHDRDRLDAVELSPFRAAFAAGADIAMSGHFAVPSVTGNPALPSTLSRSVMDDLLRRDLGFRGLTISDALDMRALEQGPGQVVDVIAAISAGVDLLLCSADRAAQRRIEDGLRRAAARELFDPVRRRRSIARIRALRRRLSRAAVPDLGVVGSAEHRELARELARRSMTLVRDDARLLPLRLPPDARLLAVMPRPRDLTPADTSSYVAPGLAAALRAVHPTVDEIVTDHPPSDGDVSAVRERAIAGGAAAVVVGTINAVHDPAQVRLVEGLLASGRPVVVAALRVPFDLSAYPAAPTFLATYSILPDSLEALADVLVGRAEAPGRLPVAIADLAPRGHGLTPAVAPGRPAAVATPA